MASQIRVVVSPGHGKGFDGSILHYFGEDFAKGRHPLSKDEVEAVEWFKTAAEAGSREAAERLAKAYTVGDLGLPRDQGRAEYWQRKAQ